MSDDLSILNDPPRVLQGPQLLHNLIQWEKHIDSSALDFKGKSRREYYKYGDLRRCMASLATRIQDTLGSARVGNNTSNPQHVVPVLVPQSPGLYISQLAILESGGAFCPINLDAPKERVRFVAGDVAADLIITTQQFKDIVTWENGPSVLLVDEFPSIPQDEFFQRPSRQALPDDLAYVMYTSGSSGTPKGVAVSHMAASQSLLAHERHLPPFRRFLQFASPSFDVSVFEIFFPLTRGCTLVGCDRDQLLSDLPAMMNELEIDAAELTPTVVGSLLQKRAAAPGLRLLLTIGEMLTTPIVEEFGGSDTQSAMLYGMYGPTEAAIHCTIYPAMNANTKPGNIGIPFDTVSTFIAAASTSEGDVKFLPIGELGELVLGGPQLAQGYLNREEQNKLAFIEVNGKKFYRTGDKARQLENGTIEILGRMSAGQVKLRGQRVELGEIEEAVYKHPGMKSVSAVVFNGVLIVFALVGDDKLDQDDILKTCAKWLPKFMIPSEIVLLKSFPYLPSGKVDKRRLEADYQSRRQAENCESSESITPTAWIVQDILLELLGHLPKNTRLAAAGLDSLMAIRVASRLRASGINITTIAVLQADTFHNLISNCEASTSDNRGKTQIEDHYTISDVMAVLNGSAKDVESTMPCTPLQSAMLSETVMDPKAYRNWVELSLHGVSDLNKAQSALRTLAGHNSILRTGFAESPDSSDFVQIVWMGIQDSQVEFVKEFSYDLEDSDYPSLHHPVKFQLLQEGVSMRILIHIHHALYDAWSLELLLDDFDIILSDQRPDQRPPFSDIVQGYMNGILQIDEQDSKEYWKDHLAQLDPRQLPTFHSSKPSSSGLATTHLTTIIPTLAVEEASRKLNSSPQSFFQAVYALILSSYLGSDDVCFGTVFSGRTLPIAGIEDIAGPCLATLPVRVDISTSEDFHGLIEDLNSTNRKHLTHSTIPLRSIKSACGVHPQQHLFDTLLIWQQTLHSYDHKWHHVTLVDTVDNLEFNLTLEVIPSNANISLKANYQQSIFPESQVITLLQQIEQLAQKVISNLSLPLSDAFTGLSSAILSVENPVPDMGLRPESLVSPVERMAMDNPHQSAIEFATSIDSEHADLQRISYAELNSRANQMGHHLLEYSILPDELVCICMEKSVELYSSILATAKVGAGYLPLTPDIPEERLQYILHEANVKVILATSSLKSKFKSLLRTAVVYVDEVNYLQFSNDNIPLDFCPENVSYCVFTSGSTGTPKGVLVTQGNLLSNLDVLEDIYPTTKDSRFLQSCSQAFDVSVFEIFFTWRIGGCICSATKDVIFRDIENAIRVLNVTHLSLTPTVAALIDPKNVPKVKFLVTAGEAVTQKVFNSWAGRGLYQGYGPSETTNICTVKPGVTHMDSINNIGFPFKNTSAFVLSPLGYFTVVPRGGEGEFCFGGSQVFRGYMDRTQESGKIIEHPEFGRLYRSGDFGRLMPDGSLAFTGRKDDQVKIRGQRIELGEINNVMLKADKVQDSITMVINGPDESSAKLVCFWTPHSDIKSPLECLKPNTSITSALFSHLDSALPAYMLPSAIVPISYLPSTPQGKVDKRLLVRLLKNLNTDYLTAVSNGSESSEDHQWSDLEQDIAKAVAHVTKISLDQIRPETSFFSLGIDSISAIFLSKTLRQVTKRPVEISHVLRYSSVVRLANFILHLTATGPTSSVDQVDFGFSSDFLRDTIGGFEKIGKRVKTVLPCTPLQEAMLSVGESSSVELYNNHVIMNVKADLETMKKCWKEMVRRHEILRTCFISTDLPRYAYVQVVLEEHDLNFDSIGPEEKQDASAKGQRERSFPEPPYSIGFEKSSDGTRLHIFMHHALYDGVALEILYKEIETLFHGHELSPPASMAPLLQYIASANLNDADKFWGSALEGFIPSSLLATQNQKQEAGNHTQISKSKSSCSLSWIEEKAKKHSTSLLSLCHAVWASILSERFQESDVCFGNVVSGRSVPVEGIEDLVAPCFNTIPVRLQNIHHLSYLEALRKFQISNADSLPFQLTPLRRIQSKFSPDGSRLFDTLFILQQAPRDLDSSIWSISEDNGAMDFPLVCEVVPKHSEDTLEIILHSHTSIISTNESRKTLDTFSEKLQAALENPRRQLLSPSFKDLLIAKSIAKAEAKSIENKSTSAPEVLSPGEEQMRDIISSYTDVPAQRIRADMSIFRLGLDSISAVQVASRLRKLGHNVMASDILEYPTIKQLSSFLARGGELDTAVANYDFGAFDMAHRESVCAKNGISSDAVEAIRPCTAVQQGMLAQTLHSDGDEYVNSMWMELSDTTSTLQLKGAWETACNEHSMLRTRFAINDDPQHPFLMVTLAKTQFAVPWFDDEKAGLESVNDIWRPWSLIVTKENDKQLLRFTAHHALYDAQSIQMILDDVTKAYNCGGISTRSSIDGLLEAIICNSQENIDAKKAFWESEENKIIVNRFPDLTPLHVSTSASVVREIQAQKTLRELEDICMRNGVTVQAAGQAAWARLLAMYTGESSTTFGMTLSGRSIHEDADKISFPTIITLPVRCVVAGNNAELLARTMQTNALLHKHQFTPLTSVQKWAGFPEGKIFDTLFAYQKLSEGEEDTTQLWKVVREEASVDYAISFEIQPLASGSVFLRLTSREDIIPAKQSEIILKQYDALLMDILESPQGAADLAPIISNELLSITPAKEVEIPDTVTLLHEFVERGARHWPNKKALEFATSLETGNMKSQSWTYNELNAKANQIAHLLLKRGIEPGQIIAVCFDKCPEASFAITGILKAGCAYVALDPNAPIERHSFILKDSDAKLILSAGKPGQNIKTLIKEEVVLLDTPEAFSNNSSNEPMLSRKVDPQDISYCLYTSGTTGTPKGCLLTHENTVQAMLSFQRLFAGYWTEDSKWLQFASFHFDVSVLEQFWSWSVGICVASAPRDLIFEDIPGAISQLGITHIDLTPSIARLIQPEDVPSLWKGVFITGGEQLKQEILDVWGEHACIYNGYGPTEATIGVTMYPRVPKTGKPSNIGPQFDNVGSFVLKPGTDLPVLRGGIGELCVSGKLVGKGYLNRKDLTNERFPTLKNFEDRVYRTGDLVRILHDGSFIFLGRADDQVKLRGQRLELSEINEVIKKSEKTLHEVVTLVLKHTTQQKEQLVTFFATQSTTDAEEARSMIPAMKDACKARLPGYMVPTHFIPMKSLPLSANNKADTKQLAAMYDNLSVDDLQRLSHSNRSADWDDSEKKAVNIIASIMQVDVSDLTRDSNIFELGLDSISIIGFSRGIQNAGLENAKISIVKSNPNIGALVKAIAGITKADQGQENAYVAAAQQITAFSQKHIVNVCRELSIESADVECIAPCTPVQEGMIYRFLESDSALYFNAFKFDLDESIDTEKLLHAWERVIAQLQILRTKFVATDDGYAQVVLKTFDISSITSTIKCEGVEKSTALQTPYRLNLRKSSLSQVMELQIFHGLYDGNSLAMLLQRVVDELKGAETIEYGPPFQASLQYGPLARVPGERQFWTEHLKDWSYQPLQAVSEAQQDVSAMKTLREIQGLERLRKSLGVTPQAVIQAAWLSVLSTTASPDITLGMVTSGRAIDFEGAEKIIGPLFNTVPFHSRLESGMSFADLISKCHRFNMEMQDFQHTPLKDIQKWSPAKPGQALFETLFVFQRPELGEEDFASGLWTQVDDEPVADYPLAIEATLGADGNTLGLTIVTQGSVSTKEGARELLVRFENALKNILGNGGKSVVGTNAIKEFSDSRVPAIPEDPAYPPSDGKNFKWTKEPETIRKEIATLANVEEAAIQAHSSIFELGLDSIDVIKLSSRLKKQSINLPVSAIIKSQTISKMAKSISITGGKENKTSGELLQRISKDLTSYLEAHDKLANDVEAVLPATPLQQSMVNEMLKSKFQRYFNIEASELDKETDIDRLKFAIRKVVELSPILRTTFVGVEDPRLPISFAQIIHKTEENEVQISTCTLPSETSFSTFMSSFRLDCIERAARDQALFQVHFVEAGEIKYLVMAVSHALYDGTSVRSLHEDIFKAYQGSLSARPSFVPFLEEALQSTSKDAKKFWRTTLSNLPSTSLLKNDTSPHHEVEVYRLDKQSQVSIKKIEQLCKTSKMTLQTLGQTCWALVLAQLMNQLDVVFGSVLSCRDSEEANEVMFPLMNTVAVRSVLHGNLAEMLTYMQGLSDSTRQYQHFPLGAAQAYALASRQDQDSKTNDTALFETLFIYQGRRQTATKKALYESVYGASDVEFPVCVEMEIVDDELVWTTACKSIARTKEEAKDLLDALDGVLARMVTNSQAPTLVSNNDGISICGLPKFKTQSRQPKPLAAPLTNNDEEEWSETELKIRKALHEISGITEDNIRKDSTIFHLGLDSILILKLPALLRAHDIKLGVSDILREQTASAMAIFVARGKPKANEQSLDVKKVLHDAISKLDVESELKKLEREIGPIETIMPVAAGQLYIIRQWQASRGVLFYPTFSYRIAGAFDELKLDTSWKKLLRRHPILRTGFLEVGKEVVQVVYKDHPQETFYANSDVGMMTDLSMPPVRLVIEDAGEEGVTLKLKIHHALYDGISLPMMVDELQALYLGKELPPVQRDFKVFVARALSSKQTTKKKWISYLGEKNAVSMMHNVGKLEGKRTEVFRPSLEIQPLKQRAKELGITIDALLLASTAKQYVAHLCSSTSRPDEKPDQVTIGIYLANRAPFGEDLSSLAAPTLNLLPIRVDAPFEREISDIVKDIQRDIGLIGSKDMVFASLDEIYQWTGVRVDCFVNILKSASSSSSANSAEEEKYKLQPLQEFKALARVVDDEVNENMVVQNGDEKLAAYLPTIDIELRYDGEGMIDMGVFAPETMLSVEKAGDMIAGFIEGLN
ncbi:peptide synthetase [Halenospora varia]|nr:peptide synthetase [Halenospora varia]